MQEGCGCDDVDDADGEFGEAQGFGFDVSAFFEDEEAKEGADGEQCVDVEK